jgi:hypothetical protein
MTSRTTNHISVMSLLVGLRSRTGKRFSGAFPEEGSPEYCDGELTVDGRFSADGTSEVESSIGLISFFRDSASDVVFNAGLMLIASLMIGLSSGRSACQVSRWSMWQNLVRFPTRTK